MRMAPIIGHRGAAGLEPENTLGGLYKAVELRLNWIEIDAALLRDGTAVVFHDEKLDRCTPNSGYLRDQTWNDVAQLNVASRFEGARFPNETMPLLSHFLGVAKKMNMSVNVELKVHEDEGVKLAQTVSRRIAQNAHGDLLVSSFDLDALSVFEGKNIPKAILYEQLPSDWMSDAASLRAQCIHLNAEHLQREEVEEIKASTRDVYAYTVNEYETARKLWDWGVDGVFSDYPNRLNEFYKPDQA